MGVVVPLAVVSGFWVGVAIIGPIVIPLFLNKENRGIARIMIIMTAVCCWSFWIMIYLHQLNPLIGPQINVRTVRWISDTWGNSSNPTITFDPNSKF